MTIVPPATNTNQTLTLPDSTGTVATLGTSLTRATAVASTSGTSIDFTSIPSWVKRITVMFNGVSTNGTSDIIIQLGDAGGIETTGYASLLGMTGASVTTGYAISNNAVGRTTSGAVSILNINGNNWVASGAFVQTDIGYLFICGGNKTLSDTLTQLRVTTVAGTAAFDAGTINIMYEG
jgi:hypothetical protein